MNKTTKKTAVEKRIIFLLRKTEKQRLVVNDERRTHSLYQTELRNLLYMEATRPHAKKARA